MAWVYHRHYVGPDRRSNQFTVRFIERRRESEAGTRASVHSTLRQLLSHGMRWVDHLNYFGPDRRGREFSFFFLERRHEENAGQPPPLHAALRQLRMRVLDAHDATGRYILRERFIATALLADAQGLGQIGDALMNIASALDGPCEEGNDSRLMLRDELNRTEAMLG